MILDKESADRLLQHMEEDKPNPKAQESYNKGKEIIAKMEKREEDWEF